MAANVESAEKRHEAGCALLSQRSAPANGHTCTVKKERENAQLRKRELIIRRVSSGVLRISPARSYNVDMNGNKTHPVMVSRKVCRRTGNCMKESDDPERPQVEAHTFLVVRNRHGMF